MTGEQLAAMTRAARVMGDGLQEFGRQVRTLADAIAGTFAPLLLAALPWEQRRRFAPAWYRPVPLGIDGHDYHRRRQARRRRR